MAKSNPKHNKDDHLNPFTVLLRWADAGYQHFWRMGPVSFCDNSCYKSSALTAAMIFSLQVQREYKTTTIQSPKCPARFVIQSYDQFACSWLAVYLLPSLTIDGVHPSIGDASKLGSFLLWQMSGYRGAWSPGWWLPPSEKLGELPLALTGNSLGFFLYIW